MFRVSYSREYDLDWYRVKLHAFNQTIICHKSQLVKTGMDPRCSVGCKDMSVCDILELGFVFPTKDARFVV